MYYSYVPIIFVVLIFSSIIYLADRGSRSSRLLLWMSIFFSVILCGEIMLWISTPVLLVQFVWQIMTVIHVLLLSCILYFVYSFIYKKEAHPVFVWVWLLLLAPVFILTPTHVNLSAFDLLNCESVQGNLWIYVYFIEILAAALSIYFCIYSFIKNSERGARLQAGVLGVGLFFFLGIFIASYVVGDITSFYGFNLFGPLGMVAFLVTITYLIVRYHVFNLRVIGAQALVIGVEILLFAALFVRTVFNIRIVLFATLVLVGLLGALLIRGVRREIKQREEIELLAKNLEISNKQQIALIHFITHQLKGFVAKSRNIFAMIQEGDYGQMPETMKPIIDEGFTSATKGAQTIQDILNASNIKTGKVTMDMKPFDFKTLIDTIVGNLKPNADAKGVALTLTEPSEPVMLTGDQTQLENAIKNLVDNTIKYTPQGSITITLTKDDRLIRFKTEDTGVGITPEDMKHLFTEGGHGTESQKVNVDSTGFGLYIVKNIIEAHNGKVWAESEGAGKGSTFTVELPAS